MGAAVSGLGAPLLLVLGLGSVGLWQHSFAWHGLHSRLSSFSFSFCAFRAKLRFFLQTENEVCKAAPGLGAIP